MAASPVPAPPRPALPQAQPAKAALEISGLRKAAILMASIGDQASAVLLRQLPEEKVHDVTREISRLGSVSDEERRKVLQEFLDGVQNPSLASAGGLEYATNVLLSAFGPETGKRLADRLLKSLGTEMPGLDSIRKADPQHLSKIIHRENPQTIALVVSHLSTAHGAQLLSALPAELRRRVVVKMARLDQISPEVVNKIAKILNAKLRVLGESSLESYGGIRAVAEVLNRVDPATTEEILDGITADDATLGQAIRNLMFVFEDLATVDQNALRALMARLDKKVLAMALKGSSSQLKKQFTSQMSQRAAETFAEDMQALGPVRLRDVEDAQQQIISMARVMEKEGAINLKAASADQFVV